MRNCKIFFVIYIMTNSILASSFLSCNDSPYMQGKRLYMAKCQNCHMEDGSGLVSLVPSLVKSGSLGKSEIACIIKYGNRDTLFKDSTFLIKEMPSFKELSNTEITNIVNYINHSWNPSFKESSILDIQNAITNCR